MADKYAKVAGGNWTAAATWASTDGGVDSVGPPGVGDNAFFSNLSGNVVVDGPATCLDFDQTKGTGYAGTLSGSSTLSVAGSMKRKGTWTYSGAITYAATATGKTIQNNGVAYAGNNLVFSGSGGGWTFADAATGVGNISHTAGTTNYAGFSISCGSWTMSQPAASVTLGAATMTLSSFWSATNGTLSAASSSITCGTPGNFDGGGYSYGSVTLTANSPAGLITGANSFVNLTLLNTATKVAVWGMGANQTISGIFKYLGNSAVNNFCIQSSVIGTARTISAANIDPTSDFVCFRDIAAADVGSPSSTPWNTPIGTKLIGNCGGNSGITFTPAATQTATGTASFTWSTHGWTSRVPLPQDDVVVSNAFIAGRTVTMDMPRLGKTIDLSGCTGSPAFNNTVANEFFGSFKHGAGSTHTGLNTLSALGRGAFSILSNAVTWPSPFVFNAPGGTYTLLDAFTSAAGVTFSMGTFSDGGFSMSFTNLTINNAGATVNKTGQWDVSGTASAVAISAGTLNDTAGRIRLTDATAATKVIAGGGATFSELYLSGAGTGVYQVTGSNTCGTFRCDTARNIQFTAGTTNTATTWIIDGCTIGSITAAGHTLAKAGGGKVKAQGVTVSRSTGSPALTFYDFGTGAVDGGNNVNWQFYNPDYSLAINPLSYALTYQPASILAQRRLICASLVYSYTLAPSSLLAARRLVVNPLVYSLTYQPASLLAARRLTVGSVVYSYAIKDAVSLLASRRMALDPLAYAYTLGDIALRDFPRDPRYVVSGSRSRSVYGSRNRTIYK